MADGRKEPVDLEIQLDKLEHAVNKEEEILTRLQEKLKSAKL